MVSFPDRSSTNAVAVIVQRVLEGLLTAWAAVSVTFFALRISIGDPIASLLSQGLATPEQAELLRRSLGLDAPLPMQYLKFLGGILRGDLGNSLFTGRPVSTVITEQFSATAELALAGLLLAVLLGLAMGIPAAWKEATLMGRITTTLAGLATALPVAFTGIILLFLFRAGFRWGLTLRVTPIQRLLLPALVLGFSSSGAIARVVQAGLQESMKAPYILAAKARGIHGPFRLLWHALRPALPPAVSLSALEASFLFAGTVVTETVFSRPGLGRLLVGSILQGDYPIAQGVVALAALIYTASHIIADILAIIIDPRLRKML